MIGKGKCVCRYAGMYVDAIQRMDRVLLIRRRDMGHDSSSVR